MRPRLLNPEIAQELLRLYSAVHESEKRKYWATGYHFNQYHAAWHLIEMAQRPVDFPYEGYSNDHTKLMSLAHDWQLDLETTTELQKSLIFLSPAALVQQVKRWRTRFLKSNCSVK
jgi:hypothetical protein